MGHSGVKQYRFVQEDVRDYTIWLNGDPEAMDREEILRRIRPYLGEEARIKVEIVDEIPVLASGKRKYIETDVKNISSIKDSVGKWQEKQFGRQRTEKGYCGKYPVYDGGLLFYECSAPDYDHSTS